MRKYSTWGKHHKGAARLLIVSAFIVLTFLGITTGVLLGSLGTQLEDSWMVVATAVYLAAVLAYPFRKRAGTRTSKLYYARQKTCDGILATVTFLMLVYMGNRPEAFFNYSGSLHAATTALVPKDSGARQYKTLAAFSKSMKDAEGKQLRWKERRKLLKEQVRSIRKADDMSKGTKAALIVLSVLIALGLIYLVLALACELSCAGSEAAAVIVGIGGIGLVILLLVITIRGIIGKKRKKRPDAES